MKFKLAIKCILIGNSEVGKSSILSQYVQDRFILNSTSTIGVDFGTKDININYGSHDYNIKLNIWDTAGDKRYKSIIETYYKNTSYILLVFDVNNRRSFNNVIQLHNSIKQDHKKSKFIFVGNKTDIPDRGNRVTEKEVSILSAETGALYILTSAKENHNIRGLFKLVYTHALVEFDKIPYTKKISCSRFNNIKVGTIRSSYIYNKKNEVDSCWCAMCTIV